MLKKLLYYVCQTHHFYVSITEVLLQQSLLIIGRKPGNSTLILSRVKKLADLYVNDLVIFMGSMLILLQTLYSINVLLLD